MMRMSRRLLANHRFDSPQVACVETIPSREVFEATYFGKRPLVVRGGVRHWPAVSGGGGDGANRWTPAYLRATAGSASVPVEIGGSYLDRDMQRQELPFSLYLDYLESVGEDEAPPDKGSTAYMAQAPLPTALLEELGRQDVAVDADAAAEDGAGPLGALCGCGAGDRYATMAWVGPKGTVTPMHRDPYHNAFAQIGGAKRFRLFSPEDEAEGRLYPITDDPLQANSSRLDPERPDLARFPRFADATGLGPVDLEPGDLLYIPPRWWHHVRSLSRSTSVSFWWL